MEVSLEWIYDNAEYKQDFSCESAASSVIEVLESMELEYKIVPKEKEEL